MSTENDENSKIKQSEINVFKKFLKKYFVAGLFVILPLWLTFVVILIVFDWTSGFSMPYLLPIFKFFIADKSWVYVLAKISSFFLTILIISLVGFLTTKLIGKKLVSLIEDLFAKIPLFGSIYLSLKKLFSFFSNNDKSLNFQKVVFIPFPNKECYCVAFSTGEKIINNEKYISVFMPTTPNPTTGFLMLIKEKDIIESDYTVEEGIQYIISAGIISPVCKTGLKVEFLEKENVNI
ncbi:MAG: DUF502 domain-containing protein [Endomicrobiaceae bacterium]|nr:DUF502 domain-containing protein [Endomicrobiaceae bacterium]MDD3053402.1 DUF502 domain-containing protein [Endomicrobiaceae bacterium]MDD3922416.1 DUF502 domain-containing protein [Endomicrobiaceae bacterium]